MSITTPTSVTGPDTYPDGLPTPRRYWAITSIVLALVLTVLDNSIANVALPSMAREFDTTKAASIWVVNAYQVAVLIAMLPLASLGEVIGYRRVSQIGMVVFTLASVACALSTSLPMLSIARAIQGLGAAGVMGVNPALTRFTYPQRMLGRAIGINALTVATSAAIGPTIAAAILAVGTWRWLFAVNIPVGLITLLMAYRAMPGNELTPRRLNFMGALLHAGTFGLLISGLHAIAHGDGGTLAVLLVGASCLFGYALIRHELQADTPIIPFDLLRIRLFSLSIATSVCSFIAQGAALVALPFEIQRLGRTAAETGLLMTPWPVAVACAAPIAGRLAERHPAGILSTTGLFTMAAGLTSLALLPAQAHAIDIVWRMALCGLGFGFFQSPNNRAMVASTPRSRSGAAGGMLGTARQFGQTLGAASVALLFGADPARGSNFALGAAAVIAVLAATVSATRFRSATPPMFPP